MKKLQTVMFKWNFLFILMLFFFVMTGLVLFFANSLIESIGASRVNLLRQVSERSKIINKAAITMADIVYAETSHDLINLQEPEDLLLEQKLNQVFSEGQFYFGGIDIELSLIVLMRNGFRYMSNDELDDTLKEITNTFWYIDNYSNTRTETWLMRFGDIESKSDCILSYGRIVRGDNGEYKGIILVNSNEQAFFQVYSDIIEEGNNVYIVDQNGIAISAYNKHLIGTQMYFMPAFVKRHFINTFNLDYERRLLISTYYDPVTHWTIIQESRFDNVFGEYNRIMKTLACILALFIILGFFISFLISRKISKPLRLFADKLHNVSNAKFETINTLNTYKEVHTISLVYNEMVLKIENLIEEIKLNEEIKRKHEMEFLQLQINPHFLHNTLFSIKCLIELGQAERAAKMTISFMHMLKQPIAMKKPFDVLSHEVDVLRSYTDLMSYRYKNIRFDAYIDSSVEDCLIPRLLLQPIVENSIFHGLDYEQGDYVIELFAYPNDEDLIIKIRDNGVGMTEDEIQGIWDVNPKTKLTFSHIGLKNVRDRIKQIYGEKYGLTITSTKREGVEAEYILKRTYERDAS